MLQVRPAALGVGSPTLPRARRPAAPLLTPSAASPASISAARRVWRRIAPSPARRTPSVARSIRARRLRPAVAAARRYAASLSVGGQPAVPPIPHSMCVAAQVTRSADLASATEPFAPTSRAAVMRAGPPSASAPEPAAGQPVSGRAVTESRLSVTEARPKRYGLRAHWYLEGVPGRIAYRGTACRAHRRGRPNGDSRNRCPPT